MQQYPNFSVPMNSGYGQNNPYMDRVSFWQQYQQNMQQPIPQAQMTQQNQMINTVGKMVDSIDVVKATDIPMDGNMYYFPKADGSEIFSKQWLANGQTRILTFKPVLDVGQDNSASECEKSNTGISEDVTEVLMKRFDDLENRIDELMTKSMTKTTNSRTKKDGAE